MEEWERGKRTGGGRTLIILRRRLINNRTMLQTPQVKHPHAPISATAHENIYAVRAEAHVEDLLVVRDQLRLGRQRRDVPDRARRVDARRDDQRGGDRVPVQGRQRGGVLGGLGVGEQGEGGEFAGDHRVCMVRGAGYGARVARH